jgi:hypothetical protein
MAILLLVGIFAFVVAILFRSNKALDRVETVERELGVLEDEVKGVKEAKIHAHNETVSSITAKNDEVSL